MKSWINFVACLLFSRRRTDVEVFPELDEWRHVQRPPASGTLFTWICPTKMLPNVSAERRAKTDEIVSSECERCNAIYLFQLFFFEWCFLNPSFELHKLRYRHRPSRGCWNETNISWHPRKTWKIDWCASCMAIVDNVQLRHLMFNFLLKRCFNLLSSETNMYIV